MQLKGLEIQNVYCLENLADLVNVVNLVKLVGLQRNLNRVFSIPNVLMR